MSYIPSPPPLLQAQTAIPEEVIQVKSLQDVKINEIPVAVNGKIHTFKVPSYAYDNYKGEAITLPFKVKGIPDKSNYHPILDKFKTWSNKLSLFEPFVMVGGAIAQVITAARL